MKYLLLLVALGLGVTVQAQDECRMNAFGSNSLVGGHGPTPDAALFPTSEINVTRTVPVFFHVVQSAASAAPLNLSTLETQIALLNQRFAGPPSGWNQPRYQFTLAGADRVVNDEWVDGMTFTLPVSTGEYAMKALLAVDPARVLNVYVVRTFSPPDPPTIPPSPPEQEELNGHALFPFPFDYGGEIGRFPEDDSPQRQFDSRWGVVIHPRTLPGGTYTDIFGNVVVSDGTTLVHEVGHYLGLLHVTDGGGCLATGDCRLSGDFVCDTPQTSLTTSPARSCGFQACAGQPVPLSDNIMYVAPNACRTTFTNAGPPGTATPPPVGQLWRMAIMGAVYKSALGEPGVLPMLPSVPMSTSSTTVVERRIVGGTWRTSPTADLVVNAPLSISPGVTVRVSPGRRLVAHSTLTASGATFAPSNATQGWRGLRFEPGSVGTLAGVTVTGVASGPTTDPPPPYPPYAAVEANGAAVTLSGGSVVSGSAVNGVLATGAAAIVTVTGQLTRVEDNAGVGVVAAGGAKVIVTGAANVLRNALGGVRVDGSGSQATVTGYAAVDDNDEHGVRADGQAHAVIRSPAGTGNTSVSDNDGGPTARSGGSVDGGQCEPGGATGRANRFASNHDEPGGQNPYDASARGGSAVSARYAFWGPGRAALVIDKDKSSTVSTAPLATATGTPDPGCPSVFPRGSGPADGRAGAASAASRGAPSAAVVALAAQAREAAWAGDTAGAFATLDAAADAAATDDDREAVFEATAALLADGQPTGVVEALEAGAAGAGPEAPWAARALGVAYAASGRAFEAEAIALALVAGHAGTGHGAAGHGALVRLAVDADSAALAVARLLVFAGDVALADTASAEAFGSALALVAASFPEADLTGVGGVGSGRSTAGRGGASLAGAGLAGVADGLAVWPNPSSGVFALRLTAGAESRAVVTVYDAAGRRVAVLRDGPLAAGVHEVPFDASALAPGVYVVVARVDGGSRTWTDVRRVTVAR